MINRETKHIIELIVVIVIAIAAIAACCVIPPYLVCHSKASKQGLECEWGPIQGCMVKMPSGNWMDYNRLRYME